MSVSVRTLLAARVRTLFRSADFGRRHLGSREAPSGSFQDWKRLAVCPIGQGKSHKQLVLQELAQEVRRGKEERRRAGESPPSTKGDGQVKGKQARARRARARLNSYESILDQGAP